MNSKTKFAIVSGIVTLAGLICLAIRKEKTYKGKTIIASDSDAGSKTIKTVNDIVINSNNIEEIQEANDLYFNILMRTLKSENQINSATALFNSALATYITCRPNGRGQRYLPQTVDQMRVFLENNGVRLNM